MSRKQPKALKAQQDRTGDIKEAMVVSPARLADPVGKLHRREDIRDNEFQIFKSAIKIQNQTEIVQFEQNQNQPKP